MKNQNEFLSEFSSNPELHKKVLKQGGVSWKDLKEYPSDYTAANNGSVTGMIYYKDTVEFGKKNHLAILQELNDFENDCGRLENKPSTKNEQEYFNWLSWFAWENMMSQLISYLEDSH